jgi:hypothetical protein
MKTMTEPTAIIASNVRMQVIHSRIPGRMRDWFLPAGQRGN